MCVHGVVVSMYVYVCICVCMCVYGVWVCMYWHVDCRDLVGCFYCEQEISNTSKFINQCVCV